MFRRRFKGLSSYPVFILTMVSIIAIGIVALRTMETIGEMNSLRDSYGLDSSIEPRYVQHIGELFIEIPKGVFNKVYEILVFSNNSYSVVELQEHNGLYGPLVLNVNATSIYFIGTQLRDGFRKPYLIDVLSVEKRSSSISYSSDSKHPPALRVVVDEGFSIRSAQYLNGVNKYYELMPVTTSKTRVLESGYAYVVRDKQVLRKDRGLQPIYLSSGLLNASYVDIDDRLKELVESYGSIMELMWFNLTRRFSGVITRSPLKTIFIVRTAWGSASFTVPVRLAKGFAINDSSLDVSINHVFNISVYDINGVEYDAQVTVVFNLRFLNENSSHIFYLGNVSVVNPSHPYIVSVNNTVAVERGVYDIHLLVSYNVCILNPPPRLPIYPYFFVIKGDQVAYGGFENYVFAKIHSIDKLKIITGGETLLYYPLNSDISVMVVVNASLHKGYVVAVGENVLFSDYLEIEYTGEQVYIEDYATPTLSVETPVYVYVQVADTNSKLYFVNDTLSGEVLIGIYTLENNITVRFTFKPVVISGSRFIIINDACRVYLLNLTDKLKLYVLNNSSLTEMTLPVTTRFQNFIVTDNLVFDEAAVFIEFKLINHSVKLKLFLHNSTPVEFIADSDSFFELPYDLVVSLEVLIENNDLPRDVRIAFSLRKGREVFLFTDSYVGLIEKTGVFKLPDRCVSTALLSDKSIVLYE